METLKRVSESEVAPSDPRLSGQEIRRTSPRRPRIRRAPLVASCGWIVCLFAAFSQCQAQSTCQHIAGEINNLAAELKGLQAERNDLSADLKKAGGGKPAVAGQIKSLIAQISAKQQQLDAKRKQLDNCYRTTDLLGKCPEQPDVYYMLPFENVPGWVLANGNWDDPKHGHNQGNPNGLQAYAFDFVRDENKDGVGEPGQKIRAARGGVVYAFVSSESGNSWGSGNPPGYKGVGNFLVIKHPDGTFGTYWHLSKDGVLVKVGDTVNRGELSAVSGNTGNSSTAHVHFDVRTGWSLGYPADHTEYPSVKTRFMDQLHTCWRPKVGDALTPILP